MNTYLPARAKDVDPDANVWKKMYYVFRFVVALYCNKRKHWIVYTYAEAYLEPNIYDGTFFCENSKQL